MDGFYSNSDVLVRSVLSKSGPWFDVKAFGATGFGTVDDSDAVTRAIQAAYAAGGGIVFFPIGTYRVNSQLSIPNTGGAAPTQPAIRLMGAAASMAASAEAGGNGTVFGCSALDLRNNAATAKIDTRGAGYLEIDHLTLMDGDSDSAAFVFTTNTVLHIHDCSFYGTAPASAGVSAANDAIVLGGTSTTLDGTANSPFQGYGTVISNNFFDKIKRAVVGQTYANGIQIVNNTIWKNSGYATGGAIEFTGVSNGVDTGNYIAGNLIEISYYKYGIRQVDYCENWILVGNNFFDSAGNSTAAIRFETVNCQFNTVILGWNDAALTSVSDVAGNSTVISSQQNVLSMWPQPQLYLVGNNPAAFVLKNGALGVGANISSPAWLNGDNNQFFTQAGPSAASPFFDILYLPNGGSNETMAHFVRVAVDQKRLDFAAANTAFVDNSSGDLKLRAKSGGGSVWLGDTGSTPIFVNGGNMFFQSGGVVLEAAAPTVAASRVGLGNGTAISATAGANGAVPSQVAGYLIINVGGTNFKVPYFNV